MIRSNIAICLTILSTLSSVHVMAQDTLRVSGSACSACRITVEHVVTLGGEQPNSIIPAYPQGFAQDIRGRWWLAFSRPGELPLRFSNDGHFAEPIGRSGKGPGEFTGPLRVRGFADSVYIGDAALNRLSVFSDGREPARSTTNRGVYGNEWVVLSDGLFVVNSSSTLPEYAGDPFHVFDPTGAYLRSFGGGDLSFPYDRATSLRMRRRMDRARDGLRFWAANTDYVIELWDAEGRKYRTIIRDAQWYHAPATPRPVTPDTPPQDIVNFLHVDTHGRLWIVVLVADPNWERALVPGRQELGERYRIADINGISDSVLEVIDAATGRLLATQRLPFVVAAMASGEFLMSLNDGFADSPQINVWRATLQVP